MINFGGEFEMEKKPIYIDSLANIWHHELSIENQYIEMNLLPLDDDDLFDEFEENITSFF